MAFIVNIFVRSDYFAKFQLSTAPYPHPPNMQNIKICKQCRAMIDKKAKICPFCRTKQKTNYFIECGVGLIAAIILVRIITGGTGNGIDTKNTVDVESEHISTSEDNLDNPWANSFTPINDFRYTLDTEQNTITLNRYIGDDTKILLSPVYTIDGVDYNLISMGYDACFLSETHITSVYIPEGVTYIDASCFNSCSSLEYLYLPSTANTETGFLNYMHEYTVNYNAVVDIISDRDTTNYKKVDNSINKSEELGEDLARAFNGMLGGTDDPVVVNIYYGGTEEQWSYTIDK